MDGRHVGVIGILTLEKVNEVCWYFFEATIKFTLTGGPPVDVTRKVTSILMYQWPQSFSTTIATLCHQQSTTVKQLFLVTRATFAVQCATHPANIGQPKACTWVANPLHQL